MVGSLIVVGTGMTLAAQLTPEARDAIRGADVVYVNVGYGWTEQWLGTLNANIVSLQPCYADRSRAEAYDAMCDVVLKAVRAGKRVCAAFYGHPGVYVTPSHEALSRALAEGFEARMLPGISAEDCLIADLNVDPVHSGWQSYEATDFFLHNRQVDTSAALVLWQVGVFGDLSLRDFTPSRQRIRALAEALLVHYPPGHVATVYEAATLAVLTAKLQLIALAELHNATFSQQSTLYIPPLGAPRVDARRLAMLESEENQAA
ncbi:MAG: SAM-dependent methyltransferase [Terricaulis sp.]